MTDHEMKLRIDELETICAEAYQCVAVLAIAANEFEDNPQVIKLLDNLCEARLVHDDVLPFSVKEKA